MQSVWYIFVIFYNLIPKSCDIDIDIDSVERQSSISIWEMSKFLSNNIASSGESGKISIELFAVNNNLILLHQNLPPNIMGEGVSILSFL